MSIPVPLDELAAALASRGAGYLLTSTGSQRPHVMHLHFAIGTEGRLALRAEVGRSARANIGAQPAVSLLWPATPDHEYSLIVDAEAIVEDIDGTAVAVITPTGAILHRPAPPLASPDSPDSSHDVAS